MSSPRRPIPATEWRPVRWFPRFGSFASHRLEQVGVGRMEFVETGPQKLLNHLWMPVALLWCLVCALTALQLEPDGGQFAIMLLASPIATLGWAIAWMLMMTRRPIFDRERNAYWCQRGAGRVEGATPLPRIRALQLIETDLDRQLELNLVLDDGARLNLVAHGDHSLLRDDADRLGEWLDIPVLSEPAAGGDD